MSQILRGSKQRNDTLYGTTYLSGIIPFVGLALLELGAIGRKRGEVDKLKLHAVFVSIFLVVAHVAMIVGMLNPSLLKITSGKM